MEEIFQNVYVYYEYVIKFIVIFIELITAGIICFTVIKSLIDLCHGKEDIRLEVSEGVSLALEFKLGSEVLRTLIVRELSELLVLGSIIVLMALLSVFIQWGIKNERKNKEDGIKGGKSFFVRNKGGDNKAQKDIQQTNKNAQQNWQKNSQNNNKVTQNNNTKKDKNKNQNQNKKVG